MDPPYYLTKVKQIPETSSQTFSISFSDLLSTEIDESFHLCFTVEPSWLLGEYNKAGLSDKKMTIFYENIWDNNLYSLKENVKLFGINVKYNEIGKPVQRHHSKISIFRYSDKSIKIAISTANLMQKDWENRTQGVWLSPRLPEKIGSNDDSSTEFKKDFLHYLDQYDEYEKPNNEILKEPLKNLKDIIKQADFSGISVHFIGSAPRIFKKSDGNYYFGLFKLYQKIYTGVSANVESEGEKKLIIQTSILGNNIQNENWLSLFMARTETNKYEIIWPTKRNHSNSIDKEPENSFHKLDCKNEDVRDNFRQWKAENISRQRAMPHIKSYAKVSGENENLKIHWFLLSSANFTKAAWGFDWNDEEFTVSNFEAGVLFKPKEITGKDFFSSEEFLLPYDMELTNYENDDEPIGEARW